MENTEYTRLIELLDGQNIKIGLNGFYTLSSTNRKKDATQDATMLLKGAGVEPNDLLTEYKQRMKPSETTEPPSIKNWFSMIPYISPELLECAFNANDAKLLVKIRYTKNDLDGNTMMILVQTKGNTWSPIILDGKSSTTAELARVCAMAEPSDTKYANLYEELTEKTQGILNSTFKGFGAARSKVNQDMLVTALKNRLPGTMLSKYYIKAVVSTEEFEESEEHKKIIYRPHGARFVRTPESSAACTIFDHLVENADSFISKPDMVVRMPRIYSNDPNEPALHYIDLDTVLDYEHEHPTWVQYFKRFSEDDARVLRAFIWSIFDAGNTGRQLLYIYDKDGFSGKSVLMSAIASVLGETLVAALQKDSLNNQFSMAKIWDKRLVIIGDNKNPYLVLSEKMHMVLGSDYADIEKKGRDSFSVKLQTKVIASGNTQLRIDPDATHERSRVIVIVPKIPDEVLNEIAAHDKQGNIIRDSAGRPQLIGDASFEKRLIAEFRSMLVEAKKDYEELCPTRSSIVLPLSVADRLEVLSSDDLDILDAIIEENFELGNDKICQPIQLHEGYNMSVPEELQKTITYEDFLAHLAKKYNVAKKTKRPDFKKYYFGIALKEN